jgi:hypothetical protein
MVVSILTIFAVLFGLQILCYLIAVIDESNFNWATFGWAILILIAGAFPIIALYDGVYLQTINNSAGIFFLSLLAIYSFYKLVYNILDKRSKKHLVNKD